MPTFKEGFDTVSFSEADYSVYMSVVDFDVLRYYKISRPFST